MHLFEKWPLPLSAFNAKTFIQHGYVACDVQRQKVCLYGAGYGKESAPLNDPTWEVWALNLVAPLDRHGHLRCDRWFDIHQKTAQSPMDLEWIKVCPVPIYVADDLVGHGTNTVRFPIEDVEAAHGASYFSVTFAYQIALAIMQGFNEIALCGLELRYGTARERTVEWACVSWWMGYAHANGVRISVPAGSWLGRHPARYGLEYDAEKSAVESYLSAMERASVDA